MSKIGDAFLNKKAFIPFITAGDPSLDKTAEFIVTMAENGADLIEIGIPFSDPVAEGVVIQAADGRALSAGTTTDKIFDMVAEVSRKINVPLVFMTYINPIFTYGKDKFFAKCRETGIAGVIVPDLPFEEKGEIAEVAKSYGIESISLIAPTSAQRITKIAKEAEGFIYCVSSLGVTGVRSEIKTDLESIIKLIRENTELPIAVGFGISTPEQAEKISSYADGVIVGSAIVKLAAKYGKEAGEQISAYVAAMKEAVEKNN